MNCGGDQTRSNLNKGGGNHWWQSVIHARLEILLVAPGNQSLKTLKVNHWLFLVTNHSLATTPSKENDICGKFSDVLLTHDE